jgi:alkylation response protein AidB-like acyl-CoA dehydrogenase
MFCLVRTDSSGKKQQGITYLLIDMKTAGLTVRPIITIDGHHETNEVFFDNVRVPVANRIGEENKGWDYAKYLLGNERSGIARVGVSKMRVRYAKELAKRVPNGDGVLWDDRGFRERVADVEVELKALEMTQMRVIAESRAQESHLPDPKTSILKIKGSELQQRSAELLLEVAGPDALALDIDFLRGIGDPVREPEWALTIAPNHYFARHVSIVGGSNEIQKNILAKSVLGL